MDIIDFQDDQWEQCGPKEFPAAHLLTEVNINGTPHHCTAVAVVEQEGEHNIQMAAHDDCEAILEDIEPSAAGDGKFYTTKLADFPEHDYVIVITPYRD